MQALEVGKSLISGDVQAGEQAIDFLTPAVAAGLQVAFPHDPLGGYPLGSVREGLSRQLVEGLPQYRLQKELRHPTGDEEDRLYPTSRAGALAKFGVGTIFPRPVNLKELNERARQEGEDALSPGERAFRDVFKERTAVWQAAKRVAADQLVDGRLGPQLRQAFTRKATVAQLRAELDSQTDPGIDRELAKYEAEAQLLARWNLVDRDRVAESLEWARTLQDIPEGAPLPQYRHERRAYDELKRARARLVSVSEYFPSAYGDRIGQALDFLEERGAILD